MDYVVVRHGGAIIGIEPRRVLSGANCTGPLKHGGRDAETGPFLHSHVQGGGVGVADIRASCVVHPKLGAGRGRM